MSDESTVYRGNPSLLINVGAVVLSLILLIGMAIGLAWGWNRVNDPKVRYIFIGLMIIPLIILFFKWLQVKFRFYELTTQRIKITRGILSKRTDELELYRVNDVTLIEPFFLRMFGVGNIQITTADASTPQLTLEGIKDARSLREELRKYIEECRSRKGTRVTEME